MNTLEHERNSVRQRHPVRNALLVLGILIFVALLAGYLIGRRSFAVAIGRARALGPTTFEELEAARRNWPSDQDAGPVFARIAQAMTEQEKQMTAEEKAALKAVPLLGDRELPPIGHLWSAEDQAAASDHLQIMADFMRELDGLRAYAGGKLPLEIAENPIDTLLPALSPIRRACKLECLAIMDAAIAGRGDDLLDRVEVMTRLHQMIDDQPVLISSLVAIATDALLCDTLERTLALDAIRPQDLQPLADELAAREPHASLKLGLLGERATFIAVGQQLLSGKLTGAPAIPYARIPLVNAVFYLDIAYGVGQQNRIIAAAEDSETLLAAAKAVEQKMSQAPSWALFTKILMPSLTRAVELTMQSEAQLRVTRIGLAIEQYRLENGAFPESLADLVPRYTKELPVDPFGGEPMRYQKTPEGVVVYSVGIDRQDDGGKAQARRQRGHYDTVFRVLSPEHRRQPAIPAASEPAGD